MVYRACLRGRPSAGNRRAASAKLPAVSATAEARQFLGRAGDREAAESAVQQLTEPALLREARVQSMKPTAKISRRIVLSSFAAIPALAGPLRSTAVLAQVNTDPLPSWNDG